MRSAGVVVTSTKDSAGGVRVFIKGGQVVNDDAMFTADVLVEDGLIRNVGANLPVPPGVKIIDATNKYVLPGGIDTQTHMQHEFMDTTSVDDFSRGTRAALAGGTTTIMDVVYPGPNESLVSAYERWRKMADPKCACDYALSVLIPRWTTSTASEMATLVKDKGVNSFVLCMAYRELGIMLRDNDIVLAMRTCKQLGAIARVHAENGDLIAEKSRQMLQLGITGPEGHLQSRSDELETEATHRACVLAKDVNCPLYVLHMSGKSAADVIAKHRKKGIVVFGEPTSAALGTDGTHYFNSCWRHAAGHVTAPPLRPDPAQMGELVDMLSAGDLHCVASDHRTHNGAQKAIGEKDFTRIPHGVNGVEERMSIVWQQAVHAGRMDPMKFVAVTSANAAKIFNMYPKKGRIAAGSDADLLVWDANAKRTFSAKVHESACDFNIFEGMTVHGLPSLVLSRGKIVYENCTLSTRLDGHGRYLSLSSHAPFVYSMIQQREQHVQGATPHKIERDLAELSVEKRMQSHQTPPRHGGTTTIGAGTQQQRSAFESSITIGGAGVATQAGSEPRSGTKISQPPGGKSSGLW